MARYDAVFVGFPVWWYVEPRIIDTFLEAYDFAGKTIVPFATSGGSGLGKAPQRMQALVLNAKVLAGGLLNGCPSKAELAAKRAGEPLADGCPAVPNEGMATAMLVKLARRSPCPSTS